MREFSVPAAYVVRPTDNVTDDVITNADHWPETVGLKRKEHGTWIPVTWRQFAAQVRELAAGFIAAGIQPGDRVALMSRTRYEWAVLDYAILTAGAVVVPIYPTSSVEQIAWILSDSGAVAAVVETADHAARIEVSRADLPALRNVWQIDDSDELAGAFGRGGSSGLDDVRARGTEVTAEQVAERRRTRGAADLAEIVYTSGTTGRPKGCMLSHGNVVANARNCMENDGFRRVFDEQHSTLLFLPLAHSYAQLIQYGAIHTRTVLGLTDMADAVTDLPKFRPTAILSVPRVWQKVYNTAQREAIAEGHGGIFDRAERCAIAYSKALDAGGPGLRLRIEHLMFDLHDYRTNRAGLGGAVQYAWSAAAPLDTRLGHFFRGCGIDVLEGYGLTETSPATNSNTPDDRKIGTVGRPIPGCTIRIAPDDEVLVKGHMVFQGYWRNEAATKEMIDADGWLHTGDLGALDDQGILTITGRKKDLIITSSGKNVAPAVLEERLRSHWLISECLVVGDARPFVAALVVADLDEFARWKAQHAKPETASLEELSDDPSLRAEFQAAIDYANEAVSRAEAIRKFAILTEDFTEAGGQLTPTLKVRRAFVAKQYEAQITALYT